VNERNWNPEMLGWSPFLLPHPTLDEGFALLTCVKIFIQTSPPMAQSQEGMQERHMVRNGLHFLGLKNESFAFF
jgi:hypothetical protein